MNGFRTLSFFLFVLLLSYLERAYGNHIEDDSVHWDEIYLTGSQFKNEVGNTGTTWAIIGGATVIGAGTAAILISNSAKGSEITARNDTIRIGCHEPVSMNVLENDTGERIKMEQVMDYPAGLTINSFSNGSIEIPDGGIASFSFRYSITDAHGQSASALVTVHIEKSAISAIDDALNTTEGIPISEDIIANDVGSGIYIAHYNQR